jgi:hypothetical protein
MGDNISSQINCRAVVATYELAVLPPSTGSTANLILGANNGNSYELFQYNPAGASTNELLLQYQNNVVQPATTKTLMTVLPTGDMQFGDNTSAAPKVYVQGMIMTGTPPVATLQLGQVYDSYFNKPTGGRAIGNTTFQNVNGYSIVPHAINNITGFSTTTLLSSCTEITVDFTTLTINGTNSGVNTSPFSLLIYLGSSTTEAYDATTATSYYIQSPGGATGSAFSFNTNSTIQLKYYAKTESVPIVYVLATLITGINIAELTITNFSYNGLVKLADSGYSSTIISF